MVSTISSEGLNIRVRYLHAALKGCYAFSIVARSGKPFARARS